MDDLSGLLDRVRSRLGADALGYLEFRDDGADVRVMIGDHRWEALRDAGRFSFDALPGVRDGEGSQAVIADVADDPQLCSALRAWGTVPGAYLGAPVTLGTGQSAGLLCALYREARPHLGARDLELLSFTAGLLGPELVEIGESHGLREHARGRLRSVARHDLRMVYQPIVDLASGDLLTVEALARFDTTPARSPNLWFAEALQLGMAIDLEVAAIRLALDDLDRLPPGVRLSVNASIGTLLSGALHEALPASVCDRLLIEVTETAIVPSYAALHKAFAALRERGARLAVDDLGAGFAGLSHLAGLRPDVVKIDRGIVRFVGEDTHHDALVAAIVDFGRSTGATVVGEGIETPGQLEQLVRAGVSQGQGYLFAEPGAVERLLERYPLPHGVPDIA
jgi:EAL domain-containing protein (putative c-di-GMP-specific phosphodiesterase class I)